MSPEIGRFLLVAGIVLVVIGSLAMAGIRLPFGRLPGDIAISGDRGPLFIPLGHNAGHFGRPDAGRQSLSAALSAPGGGARKCPPARLWRE
jgi:hypothetical protein